MKPRENAVSLSGTWRLYLAAHKDVRTVADTLTGEASLRRAGLTPMGGTVPGNFELDLMREGILPELYFGTNVFAAQAYENRHLWYVRTFSWNGEGIPNLRFEGIDTVSEIYLNGVLLGKTDNMFIAHSLPATSICRGENELCVHILPATIVARSRTLEPYAASGLRYNLGSLAIRRAAHTYGWDIFPRIISGGIWKDVYIETLPEERIDALYLYTPTVTEDHAMLYIYYRTEITGDFSRAYTLRVRGEHDGSVFDFQIPLWHTEGTTFFRVEKPHLWWPRDLGAQPLYRVTATLLHGETEIDTYETTLGIRTVALDYTEVMEDDGSGRFCFVVNGEKVFIRGTNWVPLDTFHSRDESRMEMACALLGESECNMIRIWGGGVYESDTLYRWCDENGILIWQDFMMGCASYPQTDELADALYTEAEAVVRRLRQHPSLALWVGDNECDEAIMKWHPLRRDPTKNRLTREVLPEAIRRQDPARQFLPSSPYFSERAFRENKQPPEIHLWGPRDYYKSHFYTSSKSVFASETGYHGCPNPSSIRRFIPEDSLYPWDNDAWLTHASSSELTKDQPYAYRIQLMANQVETLFGETPDTLPLFAAASQISQAEAVKFFVERFRGAKWDRTGIIWWNLLDGWPQFSDAVVDYYGGKKLAFYVLQNTQKPTYMMLGEAADGAHPLLLINDRREAVSVSFTLRDAETDAILASGTAEAGANSAAKVVAQIPQTEAQRCILIDYTVNGVAQHSHYLAGKVTFVLTDVIRWMKRAGYAFEEV